MIIQFVFSFFSSVFPRARGKNSRLRPNHMDDAGKLKCTRGLRRTQVLILICEELVVPQAKSDARLPSPSSGEQPSNSRSFGDATHRENICGVAHVRAIFPAGVEYSGESLSHDLLEARVYFFHRPEIALQILRPFKITDRYAAGVCEDVWDDEYPTACKNFIRVRGGRSIGCFGD